MYGRYLLLLATSVLTLILLVSLIPALVGANLVTVEVHGDNGLKQFLVPAGSIVKIVFNNSVTGSPVIIMFIVNEEGFTGVGMVTDESTLEYYSMGVLDVNNSIRYFKSRSLAYCTSDKLLIYLGEVEIKFNNTCVTLKVKNSPPTTYGS